MSPRNLTGSVSCLSCEKIGYPGARFFSPDECMDCANKRDRKERLCGQADELDPSARVDGSDIYAPFSTDYGRHGGEE